MVPFSSSHWGILYTSQSAGNDYSCRSSSSGRYVPTERQMNRNKYISTPPNSNDTIPREETIIKWRLTWSTQILGAKGKQRRGDEENIIMLTIIMRTQKICLTD